MDSPGRLGWVIGRTCLPTYRPRSRIPSRIRYARESRPERPRELQPREGPSISGLGVWFASCEYALPIVRFPARKSATIGPARPAQWIYNSRAVMCRPIGGSADRGGRAVAVGISQKEPAIGDGYQSREVTLRKVSRFAGALCAAIYTPTGKRFETLSTTRGADLSPRPLRLLRQPRLILKATRLDPHLRAFFRVILRILFGRSLWLCDANCGQCASHLLHLDNQRSKCRIR